MRRVLSRLATGSGWVVALSLAMAAPAHAQLNTQHLKGAVGLKSGSQPPPGGYIAAPILYFYSADDVRDRDGNQVPLNANLDASIFGAGYVHVSTKKILGGTYGFQVLFPWGANNRIQGTEIDANPGAGLTDSAVVPINLGWHSKRATRSSATRSTYRPADIQTVPTTTQVSVCGGTNLGLDPRSI